MTNEPKNRVYVSGPMTGYPDFNYPAFETAAEWLRSQGWEVASPTEVGQHEGWTWEQYMRAAVAIQTTCDAVYMLDGWARSRGAMVERNLASTFGQRVLYQRTST